jgi:multidrug efflux system membrane fusion protein
VHPVFIAFSVPEQNLPDIRRYSAAGSLKVEALVPGQQGAPDQGRLSFVNNTVDPATGTIQLKATFPNADNRLWPGQFLNVLLTLTTVPNAVVVPSQAIQTGQDGPYVFVIKPDHTVEPRTIVPGAVMGNETVVERGIAAGDPVVTDGQIRLTPGARVEIRAAAPAAVGEKAS